MRRQPFLTGSRATLRDPAHEHNGDTGTIINGHHTLRPTARAIRFDNGDESIVLTQNLEKFDDAPETTLADLPIGARAIYTGDKTSPDGAPYRGTSVDILWHYPLDGLIAADYDLVKVQFHDGEVRRVYPSSLTDVETAHLPRVNDRVQVVSHEGDWDGQTGTVTHVASPGSRDGREWLVRPEKYVGEVWLRSDELKLVARASRRPLVESNDESPAALGSIAQKANPAYLSLDGGEPVKFTPHLMSPEEGRNLKPLVAWAVDEVEGVKAMKFAQAFYQAAAELDALSDEVEEFVRADDTDGGHLGRYVTQADRRSLFDTVHRAELDARQELEWANRLAEFPQTDAVKTALNEFTARAEQIRTRAREEIADTALVWLRYRPVVEPPPF